MRQLLSRGDYAATWHLDRSTRRAKDRGFPRVDSREAIATLRPRAAVLDCLGTLLELEPPGPLLRAELARRGLAVSEATAVEAFRAEIELYRARHLEAFDREALERLRDDCAQVIADVVGAPPSRHGAVREAMLAALRFAPYPDAAPALRTLAAAGIPCVVASNWDCSLPGTLEAAGLRRLLDGVVTSAALGAAKPAAAVFEAALAVSGCEPADAVCVGDSLEHDVAGATGAGMRAVLLRRSPGSAAAEPGVPVARSLGEAVSLVLGLG